MSWQLYLQSIPYTAFKVLISINPYKVIPHLYDLDDGRVGYSEEGPEPHVYTIAEFAFLSMMSPRQFRAQTSSSQKIIRDQSIIVSGESGAGELSVQLPADPLNSSVICVQAKQRHQSALLALLRSVM
jgi:hypothetical protein